MGRSHEFDRSAISLNRFPAEVHVTDAFVEWGGFS